MMFPPNFLHNRLSAHYIAGSSTTASIKPTGAFQPGC
jgi:hypothetical protein